MEVKVRSYKTVDVETAFCRIYPCCWEDSDVNNLEDDAENPAMPCVAKDADGQLVWEINIDLNTGLITNWTKGTTANIHYKSCDENTILFKDKSGAVIKRYDGYVPEFLAPEGNSFGDYVIMHIDENGHIQNFKPDLSDIDF